MKAFRGVFIVLGGLVMILPGRVVRELERGTWQYEAEKFVWEVERSQGVRCRKGEWISARTLSDHLSEGLDNPIQTRELSI